MDGDYGMYDDDLIGSSNPTEAINMSREEILASLLGDGVEYIHRDEANCAEDVEGDSLADANIAVASASNKANSILALRLSKSARRFLMARGIRNREALSQLKRKEIEPEIPLELRDEIISVIDYCSNEAIKGSEQSSAMEGAASITEENEDARSNDDILESRIKRINHLSLADYMNCKGIPLCEGEDFGDAVREKADLIAQSLLLVENADTAIYTSSPEVRNEIAVSSMRAFDEMIERRGILESLYSAPVDSLGLSTRASNVLLRAKIKTVADLCSFGTARIAEMRNSGVKTVNEIADALRKLNPSLADEFENNGSPISDYAKQRITQAEQFSASMGMISPSEGSAVPEELYGIAFDVGGLSTRARNVLRIAGVESLGAVLSLGESGLRGLKNAGRKSIDEILDSANNQLRDFTSAHPEATQSTGESEAEARIEADLLDENQEGLRRQDEDDGVRLTVRSLLIDLAEYAVLSPMFILGLVNELQDIDEERLLDLLAGYATRNLVSRNPWGLSEGELANAFNLALDSGLNSFVGRGIDVATTEKLIDETGGLYFAAEYPLDMALGNAIADERQKEILRRRLEGETLEEIGSKCGLTRERVRQILAATAKKISLQGTRANHYLNLFREYALSRKELCDGLGASSQEWEAVSFVYYSTDEGTSESRKPASDLLSDLPLPQRVKLQLDKAIHDGYVKLDGEYVIAKKLPLSLYVLKTYASKKSITDDEFISRYNELLKESGLEEDEKLRLAESYTATLRRQPCVLSGYRKRMRYYDYREYDIDALLKGLNFRRYRNKEISTRVFFLNDEELLSEYDIDDAYELHSLLRIYYEENRRGKDIPYRPSRRMPMMVVGKTANREGQVRGLARRLAPISVDDFAEAYEEEYGVEPQTFKANYLSSIKQYIVDSYIETDYVDFTRAEASVLSRSLIDDCYTIDDIERIYLELCPAGKRENVNARAIIGLGFRVYSELVIRDRWSSMNEYFDSVIFRSSFFSPRDLSSSVIESHAFAIYRDSLIRSRRLLPEGADSYITDTALNEMGISEADMMDFASAAAEYCDAKNLEYCNTRRLERAGFSHPLLEYEMDHVFYDALLCTEGTRFASLNCGEAARGKIACLDGAPCNMASFIDSQLEDEEAMQIDELIDCIAVDFGIALKRSKIMSAPNRTDLYYSPITDEIYKTRSVFIERID